MSRVGKHPVPVPAGVEIRVADQTLTAKGKLGQLSMAISADIAATVEDGHVVVKPANDTKRARVLWGTTRALVSNMVTGVSKGFTVGLEINGVGYRAAVQGKTLQIALGFSHDVNYPIPEGITIATPKPVEIVISGADRQKVGQVAAEIRHIRPPEPYKGKGVKYAGEKIALKEGKKK